jgi:zinc transporter ZupT
MISLETNSKQNNDIQFTNNINGCLKHENCCAESQLATHKGNKALPWFKRLTSMGWLILVAAGLHKFVDGVVIGVI